MATKSELCEVVAEFIANSIPQEIRKHYFTVIFKYLVNEKIIGDNIPIPLSFPPSFLHQGSRTCIRGFAARHKTLAASQHRRGSKLEIPFYKEAGNETLFLMQRETFSQHKSCQCHHCPCDSCISLDGPRSCLQQSKV